MIPLGRCRLGGAIEINDISFGFVIKDPLIRAEFQHLSGSALPVGGSGGGKAHWRS